MVRKRDLMSYLFKGVTTDLQHARRNSVYSLRWPDVLRYRLAQYWGSYSGNRRCRELSVSLRES